MSHTFLLRMAAAAAAAVTVLPALPASANGPDGHGRPTAPPTRALELACPADRVTGEDYTDAAASTHGDSIRCLSWYGITQGGADGSFGADRAVTRAQMATFLVRVLTEAGVELPADVPDAFSDDDANPHEASLDALAALDVVNGSGDGTVKPDAAVRRDQMASFLVAALEAIEQQELADAVADYFEDDNENVHRGAINALAGLGIAAGRAQGVFDPSNEVKRDQMATFLMRLIDRLVEQGDVDVPASLRLSAEQVAPGGVVKAEVLGDGIASVSLVGCGLVVGPAEPAPTEPAPTDQPPVASSTAGEPVAVSDEDAETPGVQFTLTVPAAWPSDEEPAEEPAEQPAEEPAPAKEVAPAEEGSGEEGSGEEAEEDCEFVVTVTFEDGSTQDLEGELEFADAEEGTEDGEESEGEESEGEESENAPVEDAPADDAPSEPTPSEPAPAPVDEAPVA
jgi:hypothetical protein